jgi:hypothetical protein
MVCLFAYSEGQTERVFVTRGAVSRTKVSRVDFPLFAALQSESLCLNAVRIPQEQCMSEQRCHGDVKLDNFESIMSPQTASVVLWPEFLATDLEVRVRFPALPDFLEVVGLERGPLSLVSTTEELLERKSKSFGIRNRDYGRRGSAALTTRHPSVSKSWH